MGFHLKKMNFRDVVLSPNGIFEVRNTFEHFITYMNNPIKFKNQYKDK